MKSISISQFLLGAWLAVAGVLPAQAACLAPSDRFCADFFAGTALTGPVLASTMTTADAIQHNWGLSAPIAGVPADRFSGRWQGVFNFPQGTYRFSLAADDGVRLLIDGQPVIDSFVPQPETRFKRNLWLSGRHAVSVEYFDLTGRAVLKLDWTRLNHAATAAVAVRANRTSPAGSNLSDWNDWSTEQPFIDLFKTSRDWIPQAPGVWDTGERARLDLDANGWVRSLPDASSPARYRSVSTLIQNGPALNATRPDGEYVVLYDGEGTLTYGLGATRIAARSRPGRDVIMVDSQNTGGIQLTITATDPNRTGNYLRNIRVVSSGTVCSDEPLQMCVADNDPDCQRAACRPMEQALGQQLFNPLFLRTQVRYKALRFMSPQSANVLNAQYTQISDWSQRSTAARARWNGQAGAPLEVMTALSSQLGADAWFNMPHRATDDYMRQFARQARSQLAADRTVYIEYGNEIWNNVFSAGQWVEQQGQLAWPGGTASAFTKRINWYGKRTAEMCDIWKAEWGTDAARVVCVLGAQAANSWTAQAALDCTLWERRPCQAHGIGAVAIAPYFGYYLGFPANQAQLRSWTTDGDGGLARLFQEINQGGQLASSPAGGALADAQRQVDSFAALARQRGLALLAYEGGQHILGHGTVANDAPITNLFIAANRDPRMKVAYQQMLRGWSQAGGGLFMSFQGVAASSKWGSWGVLEHMLQDSSPKFDALVNFIDNNPR